MCPNRHSPDYPIEDSVNRHSIPHRHTVTVNKVSSRLTDKDSQPPVYQVGLDQRMYSSANKIFAVLRRNRSDPLSHAMGCTGELRAGSRSAGYERFGTGNLAPLAVLVPIPKPATHFKGASNQHPHCTAYIWMYHVGSHWIAVKYVQGNK